ncbi:hypothetical protein VaNZ11_000994 [Volvox africanus]|uniref:F-box domain-containing protein n=1 Tax=Volvox africanus TaxID=51714 RepID=A0ABQ5RPZ1_9CHLO|nr:hypothetical protein VaNZ11_000994 [Volvox africanus]
MEIQPFDEQADGPFNPNEGLSSSLSSLSREPSDASSDFSDLLHAWEAELELMQEVGKAQMSQRASDVAGASTSTSTGDTGISVDDSGAGGSGSSDADKAGTSIDTGSSTPSCCSLNFTQARSTPSLPLMKPARSSSTTTTSAAATTTTSTAAAQPKMASSPRTPRSPHQTPMENAGFGASFRGNCHSARSSVSRATGSHPRAVGQRRAAFVAGSIASVVQRKPGSSRTPGRDILLPRLPAPALDLIVPALPPATRAALRCTCKALRAVVDTHTHSLTLRPDRRAADDLNRRGTKAFVVFPALRCATVILAGSCSGPTTAAAATAGTTSPATATATATDVVAAASASTSSAPAGSTARSRRCAAACAEEGESAPRAAPPLPLSGWLVVCGVGRCLTSLQMHVGDIALVEDLAMSMTHPHLQRLELFIGRTGNPHGSPPVVQFMAGMFPGLRHLGMTWAGGTLDGTCGTGAAAPPPFVSPSAGSRRLFLDGRPRLGPLLLGAVVALVHLESLELRGFLIDTEGHAIVTRHWPCAAGRLQRLVLGDIHLMVPTSAPPDMQLADLVGACTQLRELHIDIRLPAASGMPGLAAGAGPGGIAAAALLIRLMHASRDVRTIRPEMLPVSLTRLCLPGVCLISPTDLAPLSRLANLACLQLTALGPGAGDHLQALQELRLVDCFWRQLLNMLPWRQQPQPQPQPQQQPAPPGRSAAPAAAVPQQPQQQPQQQQSRPAVRSNAPALAWQGRERQPQGVGQRAAERMPTSVAAAATGPAPAPGPPSDGGGHQDGRDQQEELAAADNLHDSRRFVETSSPAPSSPPSSSSPAAAAAAAVGDESSWAGPASAGAGVCCNPSACGQLKVLQVTVCERLDDWEASDRALLARVGKALLPLVDGGCQVRLKVAHNAQPNIWNESDEDGKPWEPVAVWRHIKAAQNLRRLKVETKALAERMARGRQMQAARRKEKEFVFLDR